MKDILNYQIGKNGINENVITDILTHLRKGKTVRVKFMKSFLGETDRKSASNKIIEAISVAVKADFKLVGNVLQISKKQKI